MDKKLVRFDWAIKYLLRNKANFVILEGFLSELLKTDVTISSLLESESNKADTDDKSNRIDVFAELASGEKVIIEVQCIRQWHHLRFVAACSLAKPPSRARSPLGPAKPDPPSAAGASPILYGVSKVIVEHLNQGSPYGEIPRIISISIVYFDLGKGEDYIYRGRTHFTGIHRHDQLLLGEKEKQMYPDTIQSVSDIYPDYYLLKVNQFNNRVKDKLDEWIYLFQNSAIPQNFQAKGISEAGQALDILRLDSAERRQYDRFIENLRDERSLVQTHYESGIKDGIQKTATAMKKKGLHTNDIAEITGLSVSEISAL